MESVVLYLPKNLRGLEMSMKSLVIALVAITTIMIADLNVGYCDRTLYLTVCQELVNQARSYEARANQHGQVAKSYQMQIENLAKSPVNQGTVTAMDSLFAQYDQNRALERKFQQMFRDATAEADRCMKSAQ